MVEAATHDPFDLARFVAAQENVYEQAITEIRAGEKRTHWMWFIFPQIAGLGYSATAVYFAIKGIDEAEAYMTHPLLGPRLIECAEAAVAVEGRSALEVFGRPDDLKLRSCATLFGSLPNANPIFSLLLQKYFKGAGDEGTLQMLK